jgi:hypothetical protein
MTDHSAPDRSWKYGLGDPVTMTVTRSAEAWQFFAFVFAAVLTLVDRGRRNSRPTSGMAFRSEGAVVRHARLPWSASGFATGSRSCSEPSNRRADEALT